MKFFTETEKSIYAVICRHDGIKASQIARLLNMDHTLVNRELYGSALMREMCYHDQDHLWHGLIRQQVPHEGLYDCCAWYGRVSEFMALSSEDWLREMEAGCARIGRNLNDTRGVIHSFLDCRETMRRLFADLTDLAGNPHQDWELVFEMRLNRARYIRIYADVLVITEKRVFSLEFKMKDRIEPEEVIQAAKYVPYLEVLFGPRVDVIPALVLTRANDLFTYQPIGNADALLPVCSGDMLFNVFDEYMQFLRR